MIKGGAIRKYFRNFDYITAALAAALTAYGVILIYSATYSMETLNNVIVQTIGFCLGFIFMVLLSAMDYNDYSKLAPFVYILCILFIFSTFIFGKEIGGNKNWIRFGPIGIQPAEITKIGFILTFASHLFAYHDEINRPKNLLMLILHFVPFAAIILLQKDMGTTIVYAVVFITMLFAAGLKARYFAIGAGLAAGAFPLLYFFVLKNYQKMRILVAFKPELDPTKYGYQGIQSKTAIGAGGVSGKGFLKGLQTQYSILPEKQTDFIFSVAGEEFGFIGCLLIIILYVALFLRILYVAKKSANDLGCYICIGVFAMLAFQALENIGMCINLLPIIGITLPFLSYGGSSILTVWMSIGLVESVYIHSKRALTFSDVI